MALGGHQGFPQGAAAFEVLDVDRGVARVMNKETIGNKPMTRASNYVVDGGS
jgi:hypothetical protein